jgi:hypothetical protein
MAVRPTPTTTMISPNRYAQLDGDAKFGKDLAGLLIPSGIKPRRIGCRCSWKNGISERWAGSCRWELLDHAIIIIEIHVSSLIRDYISYYHADRIRYSLDDDFPKS